MSPSHSVPWTSVAMQAAAAPLPEPLQMLLGHAEEASSGSLGHSLPGELCGVLSVLAKELGTDTATRLASCKTEALEVTKQSVI